MKLQSLICTLTLFCGPLLDSSAPAAVFQDDVLEDNDDCASATPIADNVVIFPGTSYSNLFVSKADKDHYSFCVSPGDNLHCLIVFTHATADINAYLRFASSTECGTGPGTDELASGQSTSNNEKFIWTNNTGTPQELVLEVSIPSSSVGDNNTYSLSISGHSHECYEVGTTFCDPAADNCNNRPARLYGLPVSFGSGLLLLANDGPNNEFGYLLVSQSMSSTGIALSRGTFCLLGGSPFGRYNVSGTDFNSVGGFNSDGSSFNNFAATGYPGGVGFIVPLTAPLPGNPAITTGDTWHFQLWYRDSACDAAGSSNFTNGLSVVF